MASATRRVSAPQLDDSFLGGGEMGARIRAHDWSATPLGPLEQWPQSLRTAVSICVSSRFPIVIYWGPQYVVLYNDAYSQILANKHPWALGRPAATVWAEIWDVIGPMLDGVTATGEATWSDDLLLILERQGYPEECYFQFSFSPVRAEQGEVGGIFTAVTETTERVIGERRLRALRDLAAHASTARSAEEACTLAARTLADNAADVPFALVYLLDDAGTLATLEGVAHLAPGQPAAPRALALADPAAPWPLAAVATDGRARLLESLPTGVQALPGRPCPDAPSAALVLPLSAPGQTRPAGFLIAGISPRRALDEAYRDFLALAAGHVATAIGNARAHEAARQRAEALAELDRAKTDFFNNVSHEFRTPLTLLLGPVEDALADGETPLAPRQRERLEMVQRNGLRLLRLVNTLLDFARSEAGRADALYEPTDLAAYTAELASHFRSAAESAGLRYRVDCPPLPQPVFVDRGLWEQIVLNLLSNAFKFTLDGEIDITLRAQGDQVALAVRDTGSGIEPAEQPHLFERFHRVRDARARTHEGSGIGLALVRELVQLHGGDVQVTSAPGEGSTFTVTIPSGAAHLPADQVRHEAGAPTTGRGALPYVAEALRWLPDEPLPVGEPTADGGADAPRARVLVADDNADMRRYLQRLLSARWTVELVSDGASALVSALARPPDLVLGDVMMPGLDGFALLRALRADPRTHMVPVVLLSARAGEEAREEGLEAGADDYLVKPFSARELLARVSAHLELARLRVAAARQEHEQADRQRRLAELSLALNAELAVEVLLKQLTDGAREIVGAEHATCCLVLHREGSAGPIEAVSAADRYHGWQFDDPHADGRDGAALVRRSNQPVRRTRIRLEPRPARPGTAGAAAPPPVHGWLAVPLIGRSGQHLGLLQLAGKRVGEFSADDEAILVQLAQMASIALENASLHDAAQAAIRSRDAFIATVSHDLRTPLTALKGYAQLMQRRGTYNAAMVETMLAQSGQMERLISDLLDAARVQSGKFTLQRAPTDLADLVAAAVTQACALTTAHTFSVDTVGTPREGNWDRGRLTQVLQNLLSNAVKYAPEGGPILVSVEYGPTEACVSVTDHGLGIAADVLPRLFEQFYRGNSASSSAPGLGLGLHIARTLVTAHGGRIWARSAGEGHGATFTFALPYGE